MKYVVQTYDPNSTGHRKWQYAAEAETQEAAKAIANRLRQHGTCRARVLPLTVN